MINRYTEEEQKQHNIEKVKPTKTENKVLIDKSV